MTHKNLCQSALIAALLAGAGFAQAQAQMPEVKAATPKGETASQYPVGLPEGQKAKGQESRAEVKAGASTAAQQRAVPKGEPPSQYPAGLTSGTPMPSTQSADVKSMNRSDKKAEARMEAKKGTADLASPTATPPNSKQ